MQPEAVVVVFFDPVARLAVLSAVNAMPMRPNVTASGPAMIFPSVPSPCRRSTLSASRSFGFAGNCAGTANDVSWSGRVGIAAGVVPSRRMTIPLSARIQYEHGSVHTYESSARRSVHRSSSRG